MELDAHVGRQMVRIIVDEATASISRGSPVVHLGAHQSARATSPPRSSLGIDRPHHSLDCSLMRFAYARGLPHAGRCKYLVGPCSMSLDEILAFVYSSFLIYWQREVDWVCLRPSCARVSAPVLRVISWQMYYARGGGQWVGQLPWILVCHRLESARQNSSPNPGQQVRY